MTSPIDPIAVAVLITARLDALEIVHTIGGSIASAFAGEPRSTANIDIVAAIDDDRVAGLVAALSAAFYLNEAALRRAVRERATVNLIHQATQIKVDVFVAGGTPIDVQQLARRQRVQLTGGRSLYVHPPEDILLQKLRWYVKGGQISDRQWRDILAIVRVQGHRLDRGYVETNADVARRSRGACAGVRRINRDAIRLPASAGRASYCPLQPRAPSLLMAIAD